jgi:2-polyprenyl-3-methyl-5-hydroxy-6-metoxy-1,4-benzoquinol methylase
VFLACPVWPLGVILLIMNRRESSTAVQHATEITAGNRFKFGENWSRFLQVLDEERIRQAEASLGAMLPFRLSGKTFLDVGSGSGLFSLAVRRMGAVVHSFDYDPQSVACTAELKQRYFPDDPDWSVEQGSVLDPEYLSSLGRFDVVYSWGVLHHTGAMWKALENVERLVGDGGSLFIAIYNDQGKWSRRWTKVKALYNRSTKPVQFLLVIGVCVATWWKRWLKDLLRLRPFETWRNAGRTRGMSAWWDVVDWTGGYPFEVAKPEQIFDFYRKRGLVLQKLRTEGGNSGCNEFVFSKPAG